MDKRNWKEKVAEIIVNAATDTAEKTVGRSYPLGIYEVEVPEELKLNRPDEEA